MNQKWAFFNAFISDVEMVLAKADMSIAARYASLCKEHGEAIFAIILNEFERTVQCVCAIQEREDLLSRDSTLQRAIYLRNPYVDPMSLIQIDLLSRWRDSGRTDEKLEHALFTTVRGIARGLQNTG